MNRHWDFSHNRPLTRRELLLRSAGVGIALLFISALAALAIARNLDSTTEPASAS